MKIRFGLGVLVERGICLFCDVVDWLAPALLAAAAGEEPEKTEEEKEREEYLLIHRSAYELWSRHGIT